MNSLILVDESIVRWFHRQLMHTNLTTAFMGTTATAVAFAYAASYAFTMWSKPAVKHANKRHTRRPYGIPT